MFENAWRSLAARKTSGAGKVARAAGDFMIDGLARWLGWSRIRHALNALLLQIGPYQDRRLVYLFVEGEVSGIKDVDLCIRYVALVSLGLR